MWYFVSPKIIFGEEALDGLDELQGSRALVVTDANIVKLGLAERIMKRLSARGFALKVFAEVEADPSTNTVLKGVEIAQGFNPDWIIGLGGGSAIDAAKAIWVLYECPDMTPGEISPIAEFKLRKKGAWSPYPPPAALAPR